MAADKKELGISRLLDKVESDSSTTKTELEILKTPTTEEPKNSPEYLPMLSNSVTRAITYTGEFFPEGSFSYDAPEQYKSKVGEVTLTWESKHLPFNARRLFLYLIMLATQQNSKGSKINNEIIVNLRDYASITNPDYPPTTIKDIPLDEVEEALNKAAAAKYRQFKSRLIADAKNLFKMVVSKDIKVGNRIKTVYFPAIGKIEDEHGDYIKIIINKEYLEDALKTNTSVLLSLSLLAVQSPNAFLIGEKMVEHATMDNNVKRKTNQLLKIDTLLKCRAASKKEVKNRQYKQRIIRPFLKELDILCGRGDELAKTNKTVLSDYKLLKKDKTPLTDSELENMNYYEFREGYVEFYLRNDPTISEAHVARRARKARVTNNKKTKTKN